MSEELANKVEDLNVKDTEAVTVLSENPVGKELTHNHPLNAKWTLWYTKPAVDSSESWAELLKSVVTFSTVEEFWGIYNGIPAALELPMKSDYHLFREGVKPEWEDEANSKGGKWFCTIKKNPEINDLWLRILLSAIGETLEDENSDNEEVNGVVLGCRKGIYRFGVWTKTTDEVAVKAIGTKLKKILNLKETDRLDFNSHNVTSKSSKALYSV